MAFATDKLKTINAGAVDVIKHEERLQGHYLTGATEDTIDGLEEFGLNSIKLEGVASFVVGILEKGVPASRIPYDSSVKTGAKTSKYIQGLKNYAMLRFGVEESEALRIAFAIARKHEKEGMPTEGSKAFSQTGERLKAVQISFEAHEATYFNQVDSLIEKQFDDAWMDQAKGNVVVTF